MRSIITVTSTAGLLLGSFVPAQARKHHHSHPHWVHPSYSTPNTSTLHATGSASSGFDSAPTGFVPAPLSSTSTPIVYTSVLPVSAPSPSAPSPSVYTSSSSIFTSSSSPSAAAAAPTPSKSISSESALGYAIAASWDATNFFDNFKFFTDTDPTSGFVKYVDETTAKSDGLAKYQNNQVYLGVDTSSKDASSGRDSVRLESKTAFNNGLLIGDFEHMPGGACGIWPAFWVINNDGNLPYTEIDIVEGVALQDHDDISMYTGPACTMAVRNAAELGTSPNFDCNLDDGGCHITGPTGTFGDSFNSHKGGVWALQVESDGIRIWQFPRDSIPSDITSGNPDPSTWSAAILDWQPASCDMSTAFASMTTVFNIDLCGSNYGDGAWGGEDWTGCYASTKVGTCEAYVRDNPTAFTDAYFLINSVKWYQKA